MPMSTLTKDFHSNEIQSARHFRVRACAGTNCTAWSDPPHTVKVLVEQPDITLSDVSPMVGHLVRWTNSANVSVDYKIGRRGRAIGTATWSSWSYQDNSNGKAEYKSEDNTASFGYRYEYRVKACVTRAGTEYCRSSARENRALALPQVTLSEHPTAIFRIDGSNNNGGTTAGYIGGTLNWLRKGGGEYQLEEKVGSGSWETVSLTLTDFTDREKTFASTDKKEAGANYTYRMRICRPALGTTPQNCGAWSSVVDVNAPSLPAPGTFGSDEVGSVSYDGEYKLTYEGLSTYHYTPAVYYNIRKKIPSVGASVGTYSVIQENGVVKKFSCASGVACEVPIVGDSHAGTYEYQIRSCSSVGCGPWSSAITVELKSIDPVTNHRILTDVGTGEEGSGGRYLSRDASYTISWGAVTGAIEYEITESIDGVAQAPVKVIQESQSHTGKVYGKTYSYTVRACAGSNCGLASRSVSVEVKLSSPSIISPITASPSGSYTVSWPNVPHADSYECEEASSSGGGPFSPWGTATQPCVSPISYTSQPSGSAFRYRVRACKDATGSQAARACGEYSAPQSVSIGTITQVNGLSTDEASGVSSDASYEISWNRVTGASEYEITESIGGGAQTSVKVSQASQSYTGKAYGKTYSYTVRACAGNNCGPASSSVSVEVKLPTPSINAITASPSGNYTVSWPDVTHADSYDWQEASSSSSSGGGPFSAWSTATKTSASQQNTSQISITSKPSGSTFRYRVRACKDASSSQAVRACGDYSSPQSVSIGTIGQVSGLSTDEASGVSSDASYTISWGAVTGAIEYEIIESIDGVAQAPLSKVAALVTPPGQESQSYTGKVYGKTYSYTVKACAGSNCGPASSSVSVDVRLAVPQDLRTSRAIPSDGNYTISWNAVSGSAGGYVLQESIDIGNGTNWTAVMLSSDNATSHVFSNREGETNYKYRVRACVTTGCTALSSESSPWETSLDNFVQVAYPAITGITLSETTDIDGAYSFTWNKLGNASKYQIRKRSLSTPLATESTSNQYQDQQASARLSQSGQLGDRSYGYQIRACNSRNICTSNWSSEVTVKVTLPAVSGLRSDENTSYDREYKVSWDSIAPDAGNRYGTNNANITYKLEEKTGASLSWTSFYNGPQSSRLITKSALSTYSYRVSSCSSVGCGPSTARSAYVGVNVQGLLAPTLSSVHNTVYIGSGSGSTTLSDGAELTWNSVQGATNYKIETALPASSTWRVLARQAQSPYSIAPQAAGGHLYRVTACVTASVTANCSANLASPSSLPVTIVTHDLTPPPLASDEATSNDGSYTITWPAVTGASRYVLEESSDAGTTWASIGNGTSPVVPSTKTASTSYSYRLTAHGMRNVSLTGSTLSVAVVLNCAIGTGVTWPSTSGSSPNTCEASTTALVALGSTVKLKDTSGTLGGSATFTCTGGALVLASSASAECGTQGTVASYPTIITTYAELKTVKNGLAKHYRLGNDIDASPSWSENDSSATCVAYNGSNGSTATCTGFTPIGTYISHTNKDSFTGSFDGAGHKITKLYIKRSSTIGVGLFGYTASSTKIKNIGVTDAYIVSLEKPEYYGYFAFISYSEVKSSTHNRKVLRKGVQKLVFFKHYFSEVPYVSSKKK